jgi:hypothetical protein
MGEVPVSVGSSITQTIATATLVGALAVPGTNLQARPPIDAFSAYYTPPVKVNPAGILANVTAPSSMLLDMPRLEDVEVSRSDSRWQGYVSQRIEELRAAADYVPEFPRPSPFVVDRAWQLATSLLQPETPTPSVVPSADGNVVFVWHKARWDLEIEVGPEETTVWAHDRNTGTMFSGLLDDQLERVSHLLDFLVWH